jgi:hypothetical protein
LGVDCNVKTVVPREIGRGTPTLSLFLQKEISEPRFVSENHNQEYVEIQSGSFVSLASNSSPSPQSWVGQNGDDNMAELGTPPSIGGGSNLYIHESTRNIQKSNLEIIELEDDSSV